MSGIVNKQLKKGSKVVPVHVMKALGEQECSSTHTYLRR